MPYLTEPRVKFRVKEVYAVYEALAYLDDPQLRGRLQHMWDTTGLKAAIVGFTEDQLQQTCKALRPAVDKAFARSDEQAVTTCRRAMRVCSDGIDCFHDRPAPMAGELRVE